jgi:hypothetical protein
MNWMIGILAIGVVAAGHALDDHRRRKRAPRPEINRWEEEGGAVPVSTERTAAQTAGAGHPASAAPNGASKRTSN